MTTPGTHSIFVSYRRVNSFDADHIYFNLADKFRPGSVFIDRTDIEPGDTFPDRICSAIQEAEIVLVIIGPDWISMQDPKTYRRRIELPNDWVRQEIELALQARKGVIPVLVRGASMPTAEQLPESIFELAKRQAVTLSDKNFRQDAVQLVEAIGEKLGSERLNRLINNPGTPYPPAGPYKPSALDNERLESVLKSLPHWRAVASDVQDDPRFSTGYKRIELVRDFRFDTFLNAIEFMKQAAEQIDLIGHHPRWSNVFCTVTIGYSTFEAGHRPTDRDHKCAEMLDRLYLRFIEERSMR